MASMLHLLCKRPCTPSVAVRAHINLMTSSSEKLVMQRESAFSWSGSVSRTGNSESWMTLTDWEMSDAHKLYWPPCHTNLSVRTYISHSTGLSSLQSLLTEKSSRFKQAPCPPANTSQWLVYEWQWPCLGGWWRVSTCLVAWWCAWPQWGRRLQ